MVKVFHTSVRYLANFSRTIEKMKLKIYTVDAFTDKPFEGNPAAVVPLLEKLPEKLMQKIALEFNLSETAFITAPKNSSASVWKEGSKFELRWFTPMREVPLCGHATLASAHALFYLMGNTSPSLAFETLSGTLLARKLDGGIALDFPLNPPLPLSAEQQKKYATLITSVVGDKVVKETLFSSTTGKMMIRLDDKYSREDLESIHLNPGTLLDVNDGSEVRGIILTLRGDLHLNKDSGRGVKDHHFISRYFAPWVGIPEDPVTGSAHTVLGPYWESQLGLKEFKCRQCSTRGGELTLKIRDDGRIDIIGKGTTVIEGEINI